MKPTLKAPGTRRLKLQHDEPLSSFAVKLNLRRYDLGGLVSRKQDFIPPLTGVRRCRLNPG
jgi:hypothetical protein